MTRGRPESRYGESRIKFVVVLYRRADVTVERFRMEAAWATPEGKRATEHLSEFVDLARSTWSVMEEEVRR